MLESLVANILNRFLKNYVSNLNYDQLKIGMWKGEVYIVKENTLETNII